MLGHSDCAPSNDTSLVDPLQDSLGLPAGTVHYDPAIDYATLDAQLFADAGQLPTRVCGAAAAAAGWWWWWQWWWGGVLQHGAGLCVRVRAQAGGASLGTVAHPLAQWCRLARGAVRVCPSGRRIPWHSGVDWPVVPCVPMTRGTDRALLARAGVDAIKHDNCVDVANTTAGIEANYRRYAPPQPESHSRSDPEPRPRATATATSRRTMLALCCAKPPPWVPDAWLRPQPRLGVLC